MSANTSSATKRAPASGGKTGAKSLLKAIRQHLCDAILPGDTPVDGAVLDDAAEFLLDAAKSRTPARSAIKLESDTSERRLRIAIVNDDMPFLVDSIAATITARGLSIDQLIHPLIGVERDAKGMLTGLAKDGSGAARESMIYIETPRVDARQRRDLLAELKVTLAGTSASRAWKRGETFAKHSAARIAKGSPGITGSRTPISASTDAATPSRPQARRPSGGGRACVDACGAFMAFSLFWTEPKVRADRCTRGCNARAGPQAPFRGARPPATWRRRPEVGEVDQRLQRSQPTGTRSATRIEKRLRKIRNHERLTVSFPLHTFRYTR